MAFPDGATSKIAINEEWEYRISTMMSGMRDRFVGSGRFAILMCAGLLAACGGNGSHGGQPAGSGGSGARSNTGGVTGMGGMTGGQATGGGGVASSSGGQVGAGSGGAAVSSGGAFGGTSAGQGGSAAGGAGQNAATGGAGGNSTGGAGHAGAGAAGNGGSGPAAIGASVDITVTVGDKSTHITSCNANDQYAAVMMEYANGNRVGEIHCMPAANGTLAVSGVSIVPLATGLGQHDASELVFGCTLSAPTGCLGVADVAVVLADAQGQVEAYSTSTKSGTFTLDQFTVDGQMSGSLDLTMSMGSLTVMIKGTFAAKLRDCGPAPTDQSYLPCQPTSG